MATSDRAARLVPCIERMLENQDAQETMEGAPAEPTAEGAAA